MTKTGAPKRHRVPAFGYPEFRRFWLGAVVSNTGSMMYLAALGWITTEVTDSAAAIAAVPFLGLLPLLIISPFAGVWADKVSRRRLLLFALAGQTVVGIAVALMVTADAVTYPRLILASLLGGAMGAIGAPVFQAVIPTLVPPNALRSAVVLNSMQFNISRALGPTMAGLLLDVVGAAFVFWLNCVSFLAVLAAIWMMQERPAAFSGVKDRSVFGDIAAGAKYAIRNPPVRTSLVVGGVNALLVFPISYVAPVLATQSLDLEAAEYGLLVGAFGLGAIVGGVIMLIDRDRPFARAVGLGIIGCAVGLFIIGIAPGLWVALVGMFATGVAFVNVTTNVLTALQANLDDRVRGRVMSLWLMVYGGLGPIGIMAYGSLAESIDMQTVFIIASAGMIAFLISMVSRRAFRVLDAAPASPSS